MEKQNKETPKSPEFANKVLLGNIFKDFKNKAKAGQALKRTAWSITDESPTIPPNTYTFLQNVIKIPVEIKQDNSPINLPEEPLFKVPKRPRGPRTPPLPPIQESSRNYEFLASTKEEKSQKVSKGNTVSETYVPKRCQMEKQPRKNPVSQKMVNKKLENMFDEFRNQVGTSKQQASTSFSKPVEYPREEQGLNTNFLYSKDTPSTFISNAYNNPLPTGKEIPPVDKDLEEHIFKRPAIPPIKISKPPKRPITATLTPIYEPNETFDSIPIAKNDKSNKCSSTKDQSSSRSEENKVSESDIPDSPDSPPRCEIEEKTDVEPLWEELVNYMLENLFDEFKGQIRRIKQKKNSSQAVIQQVPKNDLELKEKPTSSSGKEKFVQEIRDKPEVKKDITDSLLNIKIKPKTKHTKKKLEKKSKAKKKKKIPILNIPEIPTINSYKTLFPQFKIPKRPRGPRTPPPIQEPDTTYDVIPVTRNYRRNTNNRRDRALNFFVPFRSDQIMRRHDPSPNRENRDRGGGDGSPHVPRASGDSPTSTSSINDTYMRGENNQQSPRSRGSEDGRRPQPPQQRPSSAGNPSTYSNNSSGRSHWGGGAGGSSNNYRGGGASGSSGSNNSGNRNSRRY